MRFILFVITATLLFGCEMFSISGHQQETDYDFEISTMEVVEDTEWQSGIFYQATEESGLEVSAISEVTNLLRKELAKDIHIESAWYQQQQSSCITPNDIALQVVVPSTLILQLNSDSRQSLSGIFKPVQKPELVCPYYVQKIRPTKK